MPVYFQMMPGGGMTPSGWDWGSMWLSVFISSILVIVAAFVIIVLFLRREESKGTGTLSYPSPVPSIRVGEARNRDAAPDKPDTGVLARVLRSLAPTLIEDERRVMDELVKAGGEVLQSDLPRMTNFSKATVSKAIHGLEVRGIVVREKHKWTYWCKVNPRLVDRTLQEEPGLQENSPVTV